MSTPEDVPKSSIGDPPPDDPMPESVDHVTESGNPESSVDPESVMEVDEADSVTAIAAREADEKMEIESPPSEEVAKAVEENQKPEEQVQPEKPDQTESDQPGKPDQTESDLAKERESSGKVDTEPAPIESELIPDETTISEENSDQNMTETAAKEPEHESESAALPEAEQEVPSEDKSEEDKPEPVLSEPAKPDTPVAETDSVENDLEKISEEPSHEKPISDSEMVSASGDDVGMAESGEETKEVSRSLILLLQLTKLYCTGLFDVVEIKCSFYLI